MADGLYEYDADVLVVGSGAAAYAAALTAADRGVSVIMFERADHVGGTTLLSGGGTAWIPNNSLMRENDIDDPREDCLRFMCRLAYPQFYDPLADKLGLPDDSYDLIATFYDTGKAGGDQHASGERVDQRLLRQHHAGLPLVHGQQPPVYGRRLPQVGGSPAMFERFEQAPRADGDRSGTQPPCPCRAPQRRRCGVRARGPGRPPRCARPRPQGSDLRLRRIPPQPPARADLPAWKGVRRLAAMSNTGDFLEIATEIGAELANMRSAWWKQILVEQAIEAPRCARTVRRRGRQHDPGQSVRWTASSTRRRRTTSTAGVRVHWSPTEREFPNLVLFSIWDQAATEIADLGVQRIPLPEPGEAPGKHVVRRKHWPNSPGGSTNGWNCWPRTPGACVSMPGSLPSSKRR